LEKTIASLESEALAYERASDWTGTANCYEQLLVQDVEEDRKVAWRQSLEKVKEEAELSRSFEDGLIYLEEEKWNRAQMVFADIVHKRPGYSKDNQTAIRLLEKAVEEGKSSSWWQRPPIWAVALGGVVILLSAIWGGFELSRRAVPAQSDLPVSTTASETPRSISEQAPVILATQTAIATPLPAPITNTPVAETQDSDSINALLETYYEKIDDGSVEEALALINQVIEMDPNLASAFAERGFLYYSYLDDPDAALSDLARAIELDPELDWAYHQRAKLYVDLEDMDAAMADLEQAISINPNEAEYYAELGKIYDWPIQDYVNSIAYFTKALELEPDTAWYYAMRAHGRSGLGEWDAAFADINQAIILDPNDPWFFELRGDFHREAWQLHEAVSDYSISIELDPDNADLYKKRGGIYLHHLNEFDKALADYDRAIDLDPDHLAFSDRSNLHAKLGNVEEALADFESAVDYAPNDRELSFIHKQMGDTYIYDLDNPEAALVEFNKAIDIDPDFAEAHQGRGYNYYFEHAKDHDAALADINRAIELDPNNASYYEQRSIVHRDTGNLDSAIADNEDCLAIDPEFYWCHLNLGSYYDALGDAETAVTYYRDFLSLVPEAECLECQVDAVGYIQNAAPGEVELFANGFLGPFAMEFDQDRNLYVANEAASSDNGGVSKVSHNGRVSTAATGLVGAAGLAFNSAGILHVFDDTGNVYQVSEGGVLDSLVDSNDDLGTPTAIAFDANDYLYVLNCRDNGIVSVYDSEGELLEPELAGGFSCWQSIVVDDDAGVLYISDLDGNIFQIDKKTGDSSLYATTDAKTEGAMVLDNEGNLYFSAIGDDQVLRIDSSDRGVSVCLSGIATPRGLALDSRGILYIIAFEPGEIYRAIGCQQ
jgi:tetratricopeptide (TPR) repeat protein